MQPVSDPKPFQYRLWHLFALMTGTALVAAFVGFALVGRQLARRTECDHTLKVIGLALHSYHGVHGSFPPPYVTDAQGKPLYSWRVLILPWLEERDLYNQWRLDEAWDSPRNRRLPEPGNLYKCPAARRNAPYTDYLAVVGPGMAWEAGKRLSEDDFTDGTSNTILVVEVRGSQIHWAEPVDLDGTASLKINASRDLSIGSHHLGSVNVLLPDGNVRLLETLETRSEEEIKALLTRNGGEKVNWLREAVRE